MKKLGKSYSQMNDREEESPKHPIEQSQQSVSQEKINNREMIRILKK
jgi:hypothetical protein